MDTEQFIILVKEHPAIYDTTNPKHRDRHVISAIWRMIASTMNITEKECKNKWHNLRSNYMRERRKLKGMLSGSASTSQRKWLFFDLMDFLSPHVQVKCAAHEVDESIERFIVGEDASESESLDLVISTERLRKRTLADETSSHDGEMHTETKKKLKKKSDDGEDDGNVERLYFQELQKFSVQSDEEKDPDRMFLLSLLPLMKQLSPVDNLEFRIEIQEAIRRKLFPTPHEYCQGPQFVYRAEQSILGPSSSPPSETDSV